MCIFCVVIEWSLCTIIDHSKDYTLCTHPPSFLQFLESTMNDINLKPVRTGISITLLLLLFGIGMGIMFGVAEDTFKDYIAQGIAAHPDLHDDKSASKIWRYAQRAHFHATGISAFSLVLIMIVFFSSLATKLKTIASILISLISFYPLAWFTMFFLSPSLGRDAAHHHIITELFTYIGTGGLLLGLGILMANIFFGLFQGKPRQYRENNDFLEKSV